MNDDRSFLARKLAEGVASVRLYGLGPSGDRRTPIDKWGCAIGFVVIRDEVEERARNYANSVGGNHAFQVVVLDDSDRELGCDVFRLQAESVTGPLGLMTEPANEGGLVQQAQRHLEAMTRQMLQSATHAQRSQERIVDQLMKRVETAESRHLESIELVARVAKDENAQAIEMYKAKAGAELKQEVGRKLAGMLPVVLDSVARKYGGGAIADATLTHATKEIFDDLSPSQIETILGAMNDVQRMRLMHVMKRITQAEEASKPKLPASSEVAQAGEVKH